MEKDTSCDTAIAGLASILQHNSKMDEAWDMYMKALHHNPENKRALLGILDIGYQTNRVSEIETVIDAYLDAHPADPEFLFAMAGCLYVQIFNESKTIYKTLIFYQTMSRVFH